MIQHSAPSGEVYYEFPEPFGFILYFPEGGEGIVGTHPEYSEVSPVRVDIDMGQSGYQVFSNNPHFELDLSYVIDKRTLHYIHRNNFFNCLHNDGYDPNHAWGLRTLEYSINSGEVDPEDYPVTDLPWYLVPCLGIKHTPAEFHIYSLHTFAYEGSVGGIHPQYLEQSIELPDLPLVDSGGLTPFEREFLNFI